MFKWYERFNDELFNNYNSSGEATAVHIVRDRAIDISTTGKWIDIIDTHMYKHPRYDKLGFSWIIAEFFPRITKPEYTDDDYMNKYLCWQAAHNDINVHRLHKYNGTKYIVFSKIVTEKRIKNSKIKEVAVYKVTAFSKIKQKDIDRILSHKDEYIGMIVSKHPPHKELLAYMLSDTDQ
ncbi:MAG: hypothetical protein K5979_02635 [Ruminococcus sp.]|nr:hypothetical protein [Ruminococcus sp.]